jgi:predicted enzyme related to lactoylglutathione lyase
MTTRDRAKDGQFCWIGLMTSDEAKAKNFYEGVVGWGSGEGSSEFGGYFMFTRDDVPIAGAMPNQAGGPPDGWGLYVAVSDAELTLKEAEAAGATIVAPAMAVGDLGTMAVFIDPGGAEIGLWAPNSFPGFTVLHEPRAPGWFELHARDYASSIEFYQQLFGWEIEVMGDTDEFRYSVAKIDGEQIGGLMDATGFLPSGAAPYWTVYIDVASADDAAAAASRLGGKVIAPAEDTPYGRIATVADPTGAQLRVMQS